MCPSSSKDTHREEWWKVERLTCTESAGFISTFFFFNFLINIQLLILTGYCVLLWYPCVLFSGQIREATTFVTSYIPFLCDEIIQNPLVHYFEKLLQSPSPFCAKHQNMFSIF